MAKKTQSRRLFKWRNHKTNDFLLTADKPLCIFKFVFKWPKYESMPLVDLGIDGVWIKWNRSGIAFLIEIADLLSCRCLYHHLPLCFLYTFSSIMDLYFMYQWLKAIIHIFCSTMFFIWCKRLMRYLSSFAASDLGLRVSQFLTFLCTCTVQRCKVTCSYTFLTALMIDFLPSHVTESTSIPRDFNICKSSFNSL